MKRDTNQPAPASAQPRRRWRRLPVPPAVLATALLATTALIAGGTDPKLPPYVGD